MFDSNHGIMSIVSSYGTISNVSLNVNGDKNNKKIENVKDFF